MSSYTFIKRLGSIRVVSLGLALATLVVMLSAYLPNVAQAKGQGNLGGRPLWAPGIGITLTVPATVPIGNSFNFTVTFDNTAPNAAGNTGYGPFIDLVFPVTGTDGDDGIDFVSATYLGVPVTVTQLTFPTPAIPGPTGCVTHPYAVAPMTGSPLQVCGKTGDKLVVIQLPFGSFTPDQTPATVQVGATLSTYADLSAPLPIRARGGYQYGATPLSDWCCPPYDATILTDTDPDPTIWSTSSTVTPTLLTLVKSYNGPESETATGPNYPRTYTLTVTWPAGQPISDLNVSDFFPNNEAFLNVVSISPAGASTTSTPTVGAAANPPNNELVVHWDGPLTGGTATVEYQFFIPLNDADGAPIINATSGDDVLSPNNAEVTASWQPLDPRDPLTPTSDSVGTIDHTLTDKSIAIQKGVAIAQDQTPAGYTPGDVLVYTLDFQVSDFFAFNNLNITDILSDGQHFDASPTFQPTLTVNGNTVDLATTTLTDSQVDVACNYTGGPGSECDTDDPAANDGKTTLVFHVSDALIAAGQDGKMVGGCVPVDLTGTSGTGGSDPDCDAYNDGPTTGQIKFYAVIQDNFTDDYPSGDASVDHGDVLDNQVTVKGDLLSVADANTPTGQDEEDTSGTSISIVFGSLQKSTYAFNGSTTFTTPLSVNPGDTVTYRLRYTLPTSDFETLALTDYLPLPVFAASEITTFDDTISAAAPPAGTYKFGPTETFRNLAGTGIGCPPPTPANSDGTPCLTVDANSNSLTFEYGNYDDSANTPTVIDLLFTVTVSDDPFADGLFLTNQAHAKEGTTNASDQNLDGIVQIVLNEPVLTTTKGIIATSNPAAVYTPANTGPVTFNAPGTGAPAGGSSRWTGTINSTNLTSLPINSDVKGVDAGDLVTFAILVQNQGNSAKGAFDVTIEDTLPAGYLIPAGGLNLRVSHGDGSAVTYTGLGGGPDATPDTPDDIFGSGIRVDDPGPGQGACQVHNATNGLDLLIITYDLQVDPNITPNQSIPNTSSLTNYSGDEGGPNFLATPLTDTATTTIATPLFTKGLVGTELNNTNNSDTQAVIGELVTYQYTLTIREGLTPNAVVTDTMSTGLAFVDVVSVVPSPGISMSTPIGTGASPANVTVGDDSPGTGNALTFNFGDITNSDNDNATTETIVVTYQAVVLDVFSNQAGTQLDNTASLAWTGDSLDQPTPTQKITLLEPHLTTAKSVSTGPFDAGDTVTFTITVTNPNGAGDTDAYDAVWTDSLPASLTYTSSSLSTGTCTAGAPTFDETALPVLKATWNTFAKNTSCTFTFTASINYTVTPGQSISNTAHTVWSSLSGNITNRSSYNPASDERSGTSGGPTFGNGTSGNPDDYHSTSTATFSIAGLALLKFLEATSESSTSDSSLPFSGTSNPPSATIGEILRYRLIAQIPEGTVPNFQATDALPSGLTFLDDGTATVAFVTNGPGITSSAVGTLPVAAIPSACNVTGATANATTPASLPCTLADSNVGSDTSTSADPDSYTSGTDPVFKLGDLVNNDSDADAEYAVIEFNALVANTTTNNAGDIRSNTFSVNATSTGTTTVDVKLVEPSIPFDGTTNNKTASPTTGDAGDTITYTVTYTAASGANNTDAYDVVLTDDLSALPLTNLNLVSVTPGAGCTTPGTITSSTTGNILTVTVPHVAPTCKVDVVYTADLTLAVSPNQVVTNTAHLTYTSLPGTGTTSNPTGSTTPGASGADNGERNGTGTNPPNDYTGTDTASVTVAGTSITKSIIATSETHTPETGTGATGSPRVVAIGEIVRYRMVLQVPEGSITNLQLRDIFSVSAGVGGQTFLNDGTARYVFVGDSTGLSSATFGSGAGQITGLSCTNVTGTFTLAQAADPASIASSSVNCTFGDDNISTSETANADTYNENTTVRFKFGNLTNADSDANNEYVIVEFNAIIDNSTTNAAGSTPQDTAQARSGSTLANLGGNFVRRLLIDEPSIPFSSAANNKTASPTSGDAGDTITYTVTYTAASGTNNTDAFDVVLTDDLSTLPLTNLNLVSVTPNAGCTTPGTITSSTAGSILTVTVPHVSTGCKVDVVYTADLTSAVSPNQVVTNTAHLIYSSLPGSGTTSNATGSNAGTSGSTGGERNGTGTNPPNNYAGTDTASVTVLAVAPVKSLSATSEASTTGTDLAIGEIARYRLAVDLPEGTSTNLSLIDTLPTGLTYLNDGTTKISFVADNAMTLSADLVSADNDAVPPTFVLPVAHIGTSGQTITFGLGTVVNNDSDASVETVIIEFNALVNNDSNTNDGNTKDNSFKVQINGVDSGTSNTLTTMIREPLINTLTKSIATAPTDAGDTISYSLSFTNTGHATAFDVHVLDLLTPYVDLQNVSDVVATVPAYATATNNSNIATEQVDVLIDQLQVGDSVSITVSGRVINTAFVGQIITNSATVTYTSLPGAGTTSNPTGSNTPGASGDTNGERNGSGGVNDYTKTSNTTTTTLATPLIDKQTPTPATYTIGDLVTYNIVITLPEGVTKDLKVIDDLPVGLQYVSSALVTSAFNGTVSAPTVTGGATSGADVTYDFGATTTTTADNDGTNNAFTIQLTARVMNEFPGNQKGTVLHNSATLTYTNPNTAATVTVTDLTTPVDITLIEPSITTTKSASPTTNVQAGSVVTYTVTFTNTGNSPAYEVSANDVLAQGMVYTSLTSCILSTGSVDLTGATTVNTATAGQVNFSGSTWDIPVGANIQCIYTATAQNTLYVDGTHTNTINANWTSQDGTGTPQERTYDDTTAYTVDGTQDVATASFTVGAVTFAKSDNGTTTAAIGDVINYTLTITSPLGTIRNLVVNDTLPTGLTYDASSYVVTGISTVPTFTTTGSGPTTLKWDFSDAVVTSSPATITFTATVADIGGNSRGTVRTNSATLDYHKADNTAHSQLSGSDPFTIIAPTLQMTKAVSPTSADAGDTVTYTLTITHTGASNATAYDLDITDPLVANTSLVVGSVTTSAGTIVTGNTTGDTTIHITVPSLTTASTLTITYQAKIGSGAAPASTLTNTATLVYDGHSGTGGHSSTVTANATVTLYTHSVSGFVYVDSNNNGTKDGGEAGIGSVTINLSGTDNLGNSVTASTTTTAVTGAYSFTGLRPGTYTITETQPGAYLDGKDTAGTPFGGTVTNDTFTGLSIPTGNNTNGQNYNFGELQPASVGGYVYVDADNNGVKGGAETIIGGVTVTLTGTDDLGAVTLSTTTDLITGAYSFTNLRPGTYTIAETQPSGYLDGKDTIGTPGGTTNNDSFSNVVLTSGTIGTNNNFGELQPSSLAGFVYYDANNNGTKEGGELGISGVTVSLTGTDDLGAVSASTTTLGDGSYSFTNLRPGTYVITETQPSTYMDGKDTIGTPGGTTNNDSFSAIVLPSNTNGVNNNFGELLAASLAGHVYYDADNNGIFASGTESGIQTVTVTLTGTDDLSASVNTSTTTDSTGAYAFTNLRPGTYIITETQPSGYLDGKDTIGTPGGITANDVFSAIGLNAGVDGVNNDFGELLPASLSGFVYYDANNDGTKSSGELGIQTATVTLTGTDDLGNSVNTPTTTDSNGAYTFTNLRPGTYIITETQPIGYFDGKDSIGTPGGTQANDMFSAINLVAGFNGVNNNFGEIQAASLAGFVYYDANNNGVKDSGETGIQSVSVALSGIDDLGNSVTASTTTASNGAYLFNNLRPGTYTITETQPSAYLDGQDLVGTPGGTTGNDTLTDIVLLNGVNGIDNNFGELLPASLAGFVYEDDDNNGTYAVGTEAPIEGVTVTLTGTDDLNASVNTSTTTLADGSYAFTDLRPGTYQIAETQPSAYFDGKDTVGTPGGSAGSDTFTAIALNAGVNGTANNFGELRKAQLAGFVYEDTNNDGIKDSGEAGIEGVTVTLTGTDDLGNDVNTFVLTGPDGSYTFTDLRPGTYVITETTQPSGYFDGKDTIGTPGGTAGNDTLTNIVLTAGTSGADNNFGELLPSSLSGYVYYDANNDGFKDSGETGIQFVTVTLTGTTDLGNSVSIPATTDSTGFYTFTNLRPGTYVITEDQPSSYLDGQDTIGTPGGTTTNDQFSAVVLPSNTDGTDNNFGELLAASLSGYVYYDANNDGTFDSGEQPIEGVTVTLTGTDDLNNSVNTLATTAADGSYSFTGLRPGTYTITEDQPSGYLDGKDTIGTPGGTPNNDEFSEIDLVAGFDGVDNNFGEVKASSLAGFVYLDANDDGAYDTGTETPIEGVTVTLSGTDDLGASVSVSTQTLADGSYLFDTLRPGTYTITEDQPSGYFDGKDTIGTPGGSTADDVFSNIVLNAGVDGTDNNFGELAAISLGGNVYIDTNNDGVFDGTESGIQGVTVTLSGTDDLGNSVNIGIATDVDGSYLFGNLRPGTYTLTETQPSAYLDGKDTIGTSGGDTANDVFSNIILTSGENGTDNNFGELVAASLSGFVYHDVNDDGTYDGSEFPIIGATVTLTGTDDLSVSVNTSTTTLADGSYSFTGLRPGTYVLTEDQPSGYLDGKDTLGTPGGTAGNDTFTDIVLSSGVNGLNNNFGEVKVSSLSGFVYNDANNNGTFEGTESPIEGVKVTLTGTDDLGASVNTSTTTLADGSYTFTNLRPGAYALAEDQPSGYLDGKDSIGTPGGTTGSDTFTAIVLLSDVNGTDNNFGEIQPATLSGNVYADASNDGVFDSGETGIEGVTITLTGTDDLGAVSRTTTTNNLGFYSFTDLRPGTYQIAETQPSTYLDGIDTVGSLSGTTTDDTFSDIDLNTNDAGTDYNFGEIVPASLAGFVYVDTNNDGTKAVGETGISGVTITLTGTDDLGLVSRTTTTLANGSYAFTDLRLGTYQIAEDQPSAYLDGKDTIGTPGGSAGSDTFTAIDLQQGDAGANNNFGELVASSLSGYVYIDANDNGVFDGGEKPIEGATVTLTGTDDLGAVSTSTTTAADGSYSFTDLRPGTYTVTETQPGAYSDGKDTIGTPGGDTSNDTFSNIVLGTSVDGTDNNFGERASSLSGTVYLDLNDNATIDSGETGIGGVTIKLTGTDVDGGSVSLTTTTASDGTYTFTDLKAGTYTVTETQPSAYSDGQDSVGTSGGTPGNDVTSDIDLAAGTDATDYNFGELASADLSITKSVDVATPAAGQVVTFTVKVTNSGPNDTTGVLVADSLPAGYNFVVAAVTQGNYNATTGVWTVGALANGATATLTIKASVNASGPYANTAEVTATKLPDPDSTPNNHDDTEDDQATASVTPTELADLSLTKTADNLTPATSDTVVYTVTVYNHGPSTATNVAISDTLPAEVTFVSADAGCLEASGTVTCTVASLANGASASFQITVTVNDASNPFTNSAQVSASDQPDPDSTPNNGTSNGEDDQASVTLPQGSADLSLTKVVDNATPALGQAVTFTLTLSNAGPDQATNVVVTDQLPAGYTFVSSNPSQGSYSSATGQWSVGTVDADASATLDIKATVNPGGPYLNVAEVTAADQHDIDSTPNNGDANEDDEASASVTPTESADLSLTKSADQMTPSVGDTLVYTLTVSNAGPSVATNVAVRDDLPSGVTFVSADSACAEASGAVTCTVSSLAVGGSVSFKITTTINTTGNYTNTAQVSASDQPDPDSTPNNDDASEDDEASVTAGPISQSDLSLTKTVDDDTPLVGQDVTFTITVSNTGPLDDSGIAVTDVLPAGYTFVSSNPSQGNYDSGTGLWTVGSLTATGSATLEIKATVKASGPYLNTAEITASARPDPDSTPNNHDGSEDDQDTATVTPTAVADLSLTKTVDNPNPVVGQNVTFTITVLNSGPSTATGVAVSDLLPAGLSFVSSNPSQGSYSSGTGQWSVGTLTNGSSATLQLTAKVTTVGVKGNTAEVSTSDQLDPDSTPGNNVPTEDDQASASVGGIFDPPVGLKTLSAVGLPQLTWRMVWINSANTSAINVQVFDPIPSGTTYTAGSVVCTVQGTSTTTTCTFDSVNNQIVWQGSIGPDSGATNEGNANNEVVITFQTTIQSGVTQVNNQASSVTDTDNDGDFTDEPVTSNVDSNVATWNFTPTSTPTRTSAPAATSAPTATPVPQADPQITKSVNPSQAGRGQTLTFTLVLRNNGGSTATNVTISDGFPSLVDITSTSTTKGTITVDSNTRLVTATIGDLAAGETVTITITVTVNATLTVTVDQANTATVAYTFNGSNQSHLSNTVPYRLLFGQSLPTTGEDPGPLADGSIDWVLLILSAVACLFGLGACFFGLKQLRQQGRLYLAAGSGLLVLAVLLGWGATATFAPPATLPAPQVALRSTLPAPAVGFRTTPTAGEAGSPVLGSELAPNNTPAPLGTQIAEGFSTLLGLEPPLPNYPTPTPPAQLLATPVGLDGLGEPDSSSVTRLSIPTLNVDSTVRYVPFDGLTWPLTGLREDVAWLGDTSWPGLGSNTVLAAHVTVRGLGRGPFYGLSALRAGDTIQVYSEKNIYTYTVKSYKSVGPDAMEVTYASDGPQLTLITCTDWDPDTRTYNRRLIVVADLVGVTPIPAAAH